MKNALECAGNAADHMEERISKVENRNIEMIQVEETEEFKKVKITYENYLTPSEMPIRE